MMKKTVRQFSDYKLYVERTISEVVRLSQCPISEELSEVFNQNSSAEKIYAWAKENIRKVPEPIETVHSASRLLEVGAGDCDDFTVLFLSWGLFYNHNRLEIAVYYRDEGRERIYYHIAPVIDGIAMDVYQNFDTLDGDNNE